jgi:outer membrane protein
MLANKRPECNRFGRHWFCGTAALLVASTFALGSGPANADTLREALAGAYTLNPTLNAARADQRALDENVPISRANGMPSLQIDGQYRELLKNAQASFIAPERLASATAQLNVPLYTGGRVKNAIKAADSRIDAGQADLRATEASIFSQVVGAYMDVIRDEALVRLNRNNVQVLGVNVQATSDRFEIGDLTRTDVAQSQARLAIAESDLRVAESNLITSRENYIALVGKPPVDLQPPPPLPNLPDSVEMAVAIALEQNPDLEAASSRVKASKFDVDVAEGSRLPTVGAFGQGQYTDYLGTLGSVPGGSAQQGQSSAVAGLQVTLPLYQGGGPGAQVRQAQARQSAALEREIAIERDVVSQTRAIYASLVASNQVIESSSEAISANSLSLEGVRAENSVGNRTILDILNAEQELLRAQVQLITARRNAYVAGFSLLAVMGQAQAENLGLDGGVLYDPETNYQRVHHRAWDWDSDPEPVAESSRTVDTSPQNATTGAE